MEKSTALGSLLQAANYVKVIVTRDRIPGTIPGQFAIPKIVARHGADGALEVKKARELTKWSKHDFRTMARLAKRKGYITVSETDGKRVIQLTPLGEKVSNDRIATHKELAEQAFSSLTADEKQTLTELLDKVIAGCQQQGAEIDSLRRAKGHELAQAARKELCGKGAHHGGPHGGHAGHEHGAPQYVFVFHGDHCHDDMHR